ncbi:MAG: hypothetical protein F4162_09525 [Synechococcus sp. SB0676_bin_10]|uniref:Type I restriction modification DNA specificity domain-containing protein n=1 Tax=Synechococcus sp. SB0676_bin_10 TaxID=2604869 RepID=A0A6B1F9W0_9SYNE|nr:restriction endonuclease subunit S [Cyanobacteria bacterium MAG IRC4_bin_6]MYG39168.1 hypothetical protein [Synechococcus sp. SB0676_bin_10]MYK06564.1 hypothetical protein [Synechococcus sp. SB0670_bin_20]
MMKDIVPLGEIATVTAGQSPPGHTYNEHGSGLPFFQGKADFGELYPIARKWCVSPRKIAEAGDILVSVRAPVGPTNIAREQCCIGRGLAAIRANETLVLRDFLHWNIKYRQPELISKGQGSTFAAIGQKDLKSLPISLPPLAEQQRIVNILNRAAKIERLRAQAQERLREFIPALFVKMFGDPATNPMGWDVKPLGSFCILTRYGTSKKATNQAEGLPVLRMGNVTYCGDLDCTDLKWVSLSENDIEKHMLRTGDILFNRTNSKELVGKTGIWDGRFEAVAASYFIRLRVDESYVRPTYVWAFMNSTATKKHLFEAARGAIGQANINAKEVKSLLLPVPPLNLQHRYAELVGRARSVLKTAKSNSSDISALNHSLMSRLLEDAA